MKRKYTQSIAVMMLLMLSLSSCKDVTVGYLRTDNAEYTPNTLAVKAKLDPVDDEEQIKFKYPWISDAIEGVEGTNPIHFAIAKVGSANEANAGLMKQQLSIRGDGVMTLPWDHTVPIGIYAISISISNEGYSRVLENIFTITVK